MRNARPQAGWRPHTGPVPILEYHVLGAAPADAPYELARLKVLGSAGGVEGMADLLRSYQG